jgi:hypothetical protein
MQENPFADTVPTHFAIAATVYTNPLQQLQKETKTKRSKLMFAVGDYGNGKSHALERLKNDINIAESTKLAIYSSAFATKTLRGVYEQIASELMSGKYDKLDNSSDNRTAMETKGIPEKIVNLFYRDNLFRSKEDVRPDLQFGKIVSSSVDVINFICALSVLVDQFILMIDDIEEAATLDRNERKVFFGYLRGLYDQAVRGDHNILVLLTFTPNKLKLLQADRLDFYERMDIEKKNKKPTIKEIIDIVEKRLEISGLEKYKFTDKVLKETYENTNSIRDMFNNLRKALDIAEAKGEKKINEIEIKKQKVTRPLEIRGSKPADDAILAVLKKQEGLLAGDIVKSTGKSNPWIRHRLADLVKEGIITKQQIARNKPARYYLAKEKKE